MICTYICAYPFTFVCKYVHAHVYEYDQLGAQFPVSGPVVLPLQHTATHCSTL